MTTETDAVETDQGTHPIDVTQADREDSRANPARSGDRLAVLTVVLLLLGVYWSTMGGHTYSVDGETYLAGTRSLLHHTTVLAPGPDLDAVVGTVPNRNGDPTTAAPLGTMILFAPGYVLGRVASLPFPAASREEVLRLVYLLANPAMTALTAGLVLLLCRALGASRRSAALLALAFGLGTWAWPHGQTDFSEPGTALVLTATMLAAVRWWKAPTVRAAALVGLLAGCTALTRSSTMVFIPILLVAGILTRPSDGRPGRVRQIAAFGAGEILPGAMFAINAYLRFGSPFDNGYPPVSYNTPLYEGIFGQFFSPGKGLFWYAPICVVALFGLRRAYLAERRYVLVVVAILMGHLAVYGRFVIWSGENAYGPRYLIPVLPLLVALVAPVIDSGREWLRGVKVTALVGFLVPGLLGSLMYFNAVYWNTQPQIFRNIGPETPTQTQIYNAINFQPRSSPLMLQLRSIPDLFRNTADRLHGEAGGITPMPAAYEERIHWYARAIELDTWWAWWDARGDPAAGYLFLLAPAGVLVLSALALRRLRSFDGERRPRRESVEPSTTIPAESAAASGPLITSKALGQ